LPSLRIPERFRAGILRIAQLPQTGFEQLLAALQKAPSCKDLRELLAWIGDETPTLTDGDRKQIIGCLVEMLRVQQNSGVSAEGFLSDVWESLESLPGNLTAGADKAIFEKRAAQLIEQPSLDLPSARINDVKTEVERNFCRIRIFTDLRPAFRKEPGELPSEMAVIHNFQIGYHDGMGKHKEFYISLDQGDLDSLKKAIAEAEKRAQSLERLLEKTAVRLHR
jgi:hypothetical protein